MLGFIMVGFATLIEEAGATFGKKKALTHVESIYTYSFVSHLGGALLLVLFAFLIPQNYFAPGMPGGFVLVAASLPTLIPRLILDIIQAHFTLKALLETDRSTFGFLRTVTIPLLLIADITLGYTLGTRQIAGVLLIGLALILLFLNHGINKRGMWLVIFTAVNAVLTISLYKYNITHFNSVEAELLISMIVLLTYFFCMAVFIARDNPFKQLLHRAFFTQFLLGGIGYIVLSFSYLFAPASVITAGKRALGVLWAVVSGHAYFHEKHLLVKLAGVVLTVVGISLLAL